MKTYLLWLLVIMLLLSGCSSPGEVAISSKQESEEDLAKRMVALADIDFVIVPDFSYHLLLEEKMDDDNQQFRRRYVKYDGYANIIKEIVQEVPLPHLEEDVAAARNWLEKNNPAQLEIYPQTFLSESVQSQWEESDYDTGTKSEELISLETLKKLGALSRLNEAFVIKKKPDEIAAVIEAVEAEYLPKTDNILVDRELEVLQRCLAYQIELNQYAGPVKEQSPELTTATMQLEYRVDELGNPLALNFEVSFQDHALQGRQGRFLNMNETVILLLELRDILLRELGLYGVTKHNPTLTYANITLNYEGVEEDNYLAERVFIH